jgi:large subunit ribosomal protein L5
MNIKNKMQEIEIEKMVLNCGGIGEKLDKSVKLLEMVTKRKISRTKSTKRIPAFEISPGKESGCRVTIREKDEIIAYLKRFFTAVDNKILARQITDNHFSFGVKEYIEVPGLEYKREFGILGFDITVVFTRKGKRVIRKKIKKGKYPERQKVTRQEIVDFLTKNFGIQIVSKGESK